MKRLFLFFILAALVIPAFGLDLTILSSGQTIFLEPKDGYKAVDDYIIAKFQKEHPGVNVKQILVDLSSGSTLTIDAMIASGQAPDVYSDTGVRSGKYAIDAYALDLKPYLTAKDIADFVPSLLAYGTKGSKILALPVATWIQAFAVNTDLMDSVGYKLPGTLWTTADFLTMAEKVKTTGKYATILFAKNQSSDAWWMSWFGAFGAVQFANGDYTRTRLNSPQGVAALNFMKLLVDKGYAPAAPGELDDDMALEQWASGKIVGLMMQSGHAPPSIKSAVDQKILDKPFAYKFVEMPHSPAVSHGLATAGPSLIVVHKSNDATRNKLAFELARAFSAGEYMVEGAKRPGVFPALLSIPNTADDFGGKQIQAIMKVSGVMDLGSAIPQFSEIRAQMFPLLQEFYAGRLTAEQVLATYEAKVNKILAAK
ncbi:putative Bacterial extracellular solute-binding protein [Gammaproteobacteria bacterium]